MNNRIPNLKKDNGGDKLIQRSLMVEQNLWNQARAKVGVFGSLSDVIRKLLRLWIEGKIDLDNYKD